MHRIDRRGVLRLAAAALASGGRAARAADGQPKLIAIVVSVTLTDRQPRLDTLLADLAQLGWVDGKTARIVLRSTFGGEDVLEKTVTEVVALKPDVIVVSSSYETAGLLRHTKTIPIVFGTAADPVGSGFVQSLARPGGNATGFTNSENSIGGKWLQFLKEVDPRIERAGVLFNPRSTPRGGDYFLETMRPMSPTFGIALTELRVTDPAEIDDIIGSFATERGRGLILPPDSFTFSHRAAIVAAAARHRIPAIYSLHPFMDVGGLMSYSANLDEVRMGPYVDLILRGASPAELPVQSPRKYELRINRTVARELGLSLTDALLLRADELLG
ncbi:ABC transporter substrate-binding protein [Bradyrhizobium tropiciagri]|nr:ABC transporter substrate-binding protein [Bradyrhizobium tropiciagri]